MKIYEDEIELIYELKGCNLRKNGVKLNIDKKFDEDTYHISGYLFDKKTGSFPIGERFKLNQTFSTYNEAENKINNLKNQLTIKTNRDDEYEYVY